MSPTSTPTAPHPGAAGTTAPSGSSRLLASAAPDLAGHARRNGQLPLLDGRRLLDLVESSGLAGRGGAGFPTWRKLAAVAAGQRPVVVGNGAEGEPASAKDHTLLRYAPHLALDGLQLAATAVGADSAYLYVSSGRVAQSVRAALKERRRASWDRLPVEVVEAPDAFISGEESAVASRISGGPALPMDTPRRIIESGVRGRPTLVQNVETLAHLALISRYGAGWFREAGTVEEPGTFLTTISGSVRAPGVYEAAYGTSVGDLLRLADGPNQPLQAVLVGGYHGAWLPLPHAEYVPYTKEALRPYGAAPGAGVLVALPVAACGLVESARILSYLAGQSAGQCGPCLNGLPAMADTLVRLARGEGDRYLPQQLERLGASVEGRGSCRHPDGTVRFVRSTLRTFEREIGLHLSGRCSARRS